MGKRSSFERNPRDLYKTPLKAVLPLVPHLPSNFSFSEPCAGDGKLISHLESLANCSCAQASDIVPLAEDIEEKDVFTLTSEDFKHCDLIITNPPWKVDILHPLIEHLSNFKPTWLLFYSDWAYTHQSKVLVRERLCKMVAVGRVKWVEDSAGVGKDNSSWYLFDKNKDKPTEFVGML